MCGTNRACMQTLPCSHQVCSINQSQLCTMSNVHPQVVCRKCFVRTIQMAVAQKRLPLRCIMCRAKVLKIKQNQRNQQQEAKETAKEDPCDGLPKSVSGYNINNNNNNISYSGSNYSFTSGCNIQKEPKLVPLLCVNRSLSRLLGEQ